MIGLEGSKMGNTAVCSTTGADTTFEGIKATRAIQDVMSLFKISPKLNRAVYSPSLFRATP